MADPKSPHVFEGLVKDMEGNLIDGVTLTFINTTTSGSTALTDTSGSDSDIPGTGEFSKNLGEFTNGWSDGDNIDVIASLSGTFRTNSQTIAINQQAGNANLVIVMVGLDVIAGDNLSNSKPVTPYPHLMSRMRKTFWKGIDDEDAVDGATSAAVNIGEDQFLELIPGQVAYITGIFVGMDGTTDDAVVHLVKNSKSDGSGTSRRITKDIAGSGSKPVHASLQCPVRVAYESGVAQSILLKTIASGVTDDYICSFRGYIEYE